MLIQLKSVSTDRDYKIKVILSMIPLFLFMALQDDYGIDYGGYEDYYYSVRNSSDFLNVNTHMEVGYAILNKYISSFRLLVILISFLYCFAVGSFLYKYVSPRNLWFAVVLFFLSGDKTIFFAMSAFRNVIAISIFLICIVYNKNRRLIYTCLLALFAYSFHSSAIVYIALAYLVGSYTPMSKTHTYVYMSILLIVAIASSTKLVTYLQPIVNVMDQYEEQYNSLYNMVEAGATTGYMALFCGVAISSYLLFILNTRLLTEEENQVMKLSLLYGIAFCLGPLNLRMSHYFILPFIVAVTSIVDDWQGKYLNKLFVFFIIAVCSYNFFYVFMNEKNFIYLVNYRSIWGIF